MPVPLPPTWRPTRALAAAAPRARAVLLCSPADPTGARARAGAPCASCARGVPERVTVVVDEALAEFGPDGDDAAALVGELPNLLVVRSFSKAHALAGLRAGAALGPPELVARLAPSGGLGAPAPGRRRLGRLATAGASSRRAGARRGGRAAHERLAAALGGLAARRAAPGDACRSRGSPPTRRTARRSPRGWPRARSSSRPGRLWGDERHVRAPLRGPAAIDRLAGALVG